MLHADSFREMDSTSMFGIPLGDTLQEMGYTSVHGYEQLVRNISSCLTDELYESVLILVQFEHNPYNTISSHDHVPRLVHVHLTCMFAFALSKLGEYTRSNALYQQCLDTIVCMSSILSPQLSEQLRANLYLKMALNSAQLGKPLPLPGTIEHTQQHLRDSLSRLCMIPVHLRNVPVLLCMAKQLLALGKLSEACTAFHSLLQLNPLAIEVYISLISLQESITLPSQITLEHPWLESLLQIHSALQAHDYSLAQRTCNRLLQQYPDNLHLHSLLVQTNLHFGLVPQTLSLFDQSLSLDPHLLQDMDIFAWLLRSRSDKHRLNRLCVRLLSEHRTRSETWIAMALYCDLDEDSRRALQYADTALTLAQGKGQVACYLVKGFLCLGLAAVLEDAEEDGEDSDDSQELIQQAVEAYKAAQRLDDNSLAAVQGRVEAELAGRNMKEALSVAKGAYGRWKGNAKAEVLLASVLGHSERSELLGSCRTLYRNALQRFRKDGVVLVQAVLGLAKLYEDRKQYEQAIQELRKPLQDEGGELSEGDRVVLLHRMGEIYAKSGDVQQAFAHFNAALSAAPEGFYEPSVHALEELELSF